jgi:Fe2+ or Zn2+ uptake regulation protein
VAKGKRTHGRLSIFKGREAKLNYAIFQVLALKGPQTIYEMHKDLKAQKRFRYIRYATVNKRIKLLRESGYVNKIGVRKTKAGFEAAIYELTVRAYLALIVNRINMDYFIEKAEEDALLSALATLLSSINLS